MYNEPYGGEPYWQEIQKVRPDAQGRYTVLLGEITPGGLPPDIFASRGRHWLGVQAAGEPEQPRILLVELPSAWKADPINTGVDTSISIGKRSILPRDPAERRLALLLSIMFLLGTAMARRELVKWWRARTELYGEPPFVNLLSSVPRPGKLRRAADLLRFPAERLHAIRTHFQHSIQTIDKDEKAA